ncbi:uncharacterized protein Fot_38133 [Forsythia ovata]|uniref:Uncharacterized protein n=1 Tax=Forsythia ovata TaxID=205694 RepID=A0ABD1S0X6_9LAMI
MLQRNKKLRATMPQRQMMLTYGDYVAPSSQKMLMLTNGNPTVDFQSSCSDQKSKHWRITKDVLSNSRTNSFSSPTVHGKLDSNDGDDRLSSVKEISWDTMFQAPRFLPFLATLITPPTCRRNLSGYRKMQNMIGLIGSNSHGG